MKGGAAAMPERFMYNLHTGGADRREALLRLLAEDSGSEILHERFRISGEDVLSLVQLRNGLFLINIRLFSLLFDKDVERAYLLQCDPECECCAKGGTHFPLLVNGELIVQYYGGSRMRTIRMAWPPRMEKQVFGVGMELDAKEEAGIPLAGW